MVDKPEHIVPKGKKSAEKAFRELVGQFREADEICSNHGSCIY